jgi:hypothetical protein
MKGIGITSVLKLVLLIGVAASSVSCSHSGKKHPLSPDKANLTWRGDYDPATHRMTYTGDWAGCGWWFGDDSIMPAADFSKYDQLVVSVDNIVGNNTKLFLNVRYTTTDDISSGTAPIVDGRSTIRVDLNPDNKSHVLEVYVMSQYPCELTLGDSYLCEAIKYGKPHDIKSFGGFIDASEFKNYSDDAMVSFIYSAEGEMTHVSEDGIIEPMNNWGIGKIYSSADISENVCPGRQIILEKIGEQSFDCRLGDIRYMLELEGDDGRHGLYWKVWTGGNITDVHMINATIREALQ